MNRPYTRRFGVHRGAGAFEYTGPIRTERLTLRAFEPGDLDASLAMRSDPMAVCYLCFDVQTAEQIRPTLEQKIAIHADGDVLALAAVLRTTGEVVGDLILRCLSWQHGEIELGFIAHPAHRGRGYTTEASRALMDLAFTEVGAHRVVGQTG